MLSYDCQIRVWYKHTDQMAICHHSNYICYYEAARSELLRWLGMSFAEVEKRGIMMPILEVQSKYHRPAYYDELLTVRIMLKELPTARINFFYEIYNEKGHDAAGLHPQRHAPPVPRSRLVPAAGHQQVDGGVEAAATPPMILTTERLRSDAMAETLARIPHIRYTTKPAPGFRRRLRLRIK